MLRTLTSFCPGFRLQLRANNHMLRLGVSKYVHQNKTHRWKSWLLSLEISNVRLTFHQTVFNMQQLDYYISHIQCLMKSTRYFVHLSSKKVHQTSLTLRGSLQDNQSVLLVLEFDHVLDSSVTVVDIHSADLRADDKTSSGEEWKTKW